MIGHEKKSCTSQFCRVSCSSNGMHYLSLHDKNEGASQDIHNDSCSYFVKLKSMTFLPGSTSASNVEAVVYLAGNPFSSAAVSN